LTVREQLVLWAVMFGGLGTAGAAIALAQRNQPAKPVSMARVNALNVWFIVFVALFVGWMIASRWL
jgi:hypothetical protein